MKLEFRIGQLIGRLSNGLQSDHGHIYHAVVRKMVKMEKCPYSNWGRDPIKSQEKRERSVSLCGRRPGPKSIGWDFENFSSNLDNEVTCTKCKERLEKLKISV